MSDNSTEPNLRNVPTDIFETARKTWNSLARFYESHRLEPGSLDSLVEFPAQLELLGEFRGKSILDLGCGSGLKARYLATNGAKRVVAVDICDEFIESAQARDNPKNISFIKGSLRDIRKISAFKNEKFDLVTIFQAASYSDDLTVTFSAIHEFLKEDGHCVVSFAHPIRFAVERAERLDTPVGSAYRKEGLYSYPSHWNPEITLEHYTYSFSSILNAFANSGFRVVRCLEPDLTPDQRQRYPAKGAWMDKYCGMIVFNLAKTEKTIATHSPRTPQETPVTKNSSPTCLKVLSDAISEKHKNILVSEMNDSCLRLAVNEGIYDWHHHPNSDELFMVMEGCLEIEFMNRSPVALKPGDIFTIPAKTVHRTIARSRTVNICFELKNAETVFVKHE